MGETLKSPISILIVKKEVTMFTREYWRSAAGGTIILGIIALGVALYFFWSPSKETTHTYPLAGRSYHPQALPEWDLAWGADGKLHFRGGNPTFRVDYSLEFSAGEYMVSGPCEVHVDQDRNGLGAKNPLTAVKGQRFYINPATGSDIAWGWMACDARTSEALMTPIEKVGP